MFAGERSNLGGFESINMDKQTHSQFFLGQFKDSDWSPVSFTYRFRTSQAFSVKFKGKKTGLVLPPPPTFQVQDTAS